MNLVRTLPWLLLAACATLPSTSGGDRRPPQMVIAGAVEVGEASLPDSVTNDNYADCMVRCRNLYDPCSGPYAPASLPVVSRERCEPSASSCMWDCWHRYRRSE